MVIGWINFIMTNCSIEDDGGTKPYGKFTVRA